MPLYLLQHPHRYPSHDPLPAMQLLSTSAIASVVSKALSSSLIPGFSIVVGSLNRSSVLNKGRTNNLYKIGDRRAIIVRTQIKLALGWIDRRREGEREFEENIPPKRELARLTLDGGQSIHPGLSGIHKGTNLEDSIQALTGAVTLAMATHRRPGPMNLHYCHRFDPHVAKGRPSCAELVQTKIAELKRASSPSEPVCFKCGDRGHIAAHSLLSHAIPSVELPKSDPLSQNPISDISI